MHDPIRMTALTAALLTTAAFAAPGASAQQTTGPAGQAEITTEAQMTPAATGEAPVVNAARLVEIDDDFVLPTLNMPVDAIDDWDVVDINGNELGELEEVLGPDSNTATAAAIEFDGPGWFFNDNDVTRVVDISALTIQDGRLVLDMTEEEVRSLPVYDD